MKKRILALLLAVCVACSMLILPASASGSNTAVQTAVTLGGLTSDQTANLAAPLTRGALTKLMVAFSAYRESAKTQGSTGTLFSDVGSGSAYAPYVRIAVQQGWISGYTDGSFRPDNAVTLEEACTAVLKLLGYDVTTLSGTFPAAQLNKANELGLRDNLTKTQGEGMTLEDGAVLLYNALTATTAEGKVYASSLGFTVNNGVVDVSSILLSNVKGPFVAGLGTQLPFAPTAVYRNDTVTTDATLNAYDVYYYNETAQTVWIYTRKAAGRITAVAPSANAPTSVTVAGTEYTIASSSVAAQLSALNGGGVGQVVTLLLGMNNEVAGIVTGEEADSVFYGVVQSASRNLIEEDNGADVLQKVSVLCTDGIVRSVNVDKSLNFPTGWLVKISVDGANGENVKKISSRSVSGTVNADATALGDAALADDVEIMDTTSGGAAGAIRPSRLSGVTLSGSDVRYYTTNENGQIDRLILNDVTGDLWNYGVLDDVKNLAANYSSIKTLVTTDSSGNTTTKTTVDEVKNLLVPTTSEILWGVISGDILSTAWNRLTGNTAGLLGIGFRQIGAITGAPLSNIFNFIGGGANYICYINGQQASLTTSIKYPVLAGGIAVSQEASGSVKSMMQLMPMKIDKVGAASVLSGDKRYEMADDTQVYLWYKGQYYATKLAYVNSDDYYLTGWYDNFGCTAGKKVRVIIAVKKD